MGNLCEELGRPKKRKYGIIYNGKVKVFEKFCGKERR